MTEHAFVEKATGIVALPEDDPAHINCLLRFLYAGDYTAPKELEHPVAFEYSGGKDGGLRSTADEETSEVINQQKFEIGEELAELYVLDDKYQVNKQTAWHLPLLLELPTPPTRSRWSEEGNTDSALS